MHRSIVRLSAAAAALAFSAGAAGTAQAASPGQICHPISFTTIYDVGPFDTSYSVGSAGWIRIEDYSPLHGGQTTYIGHGTGQGTGWFYRGTIDQNSCRYT